MLFICVMAGIGILLYGMPACLERRASQVDSLSGRIDQEQQAHLEQSFQRRKSRFRVVELLVRRSDWLQRASEWTGVDRKKTEEVLARLHWKVSVAEIVWCRGLSLMLVVVSLLYLLIAMYSGKSLGLAISWPLMTSLGLYVLPTLLLEWADKRAKAEIQAQVPVFFSIVQSLVEAGMPLQSAVKQTARRFDARLGHELARLETEEKRYGTWRKALEEMAYRWEVDALTTIAMEMNEAIRKGISISHMLAIQVEEQMRQQEDEASARMNRLNIRLLPFVIVLMGVPLLFLVMGPVLMGINERM